MSKEKERKPYTAIIWDGTKRGHDKPGIYVSIEPKKLPKSEKKEGEQQKEAPNPDQGPFTLLEVAEKFSDRLGPEPELTLAWWYLTRFEGAYMHYTQTLTPRPVPEYFREQVQNYVDELQQQNN